MQINKDIALRKSLKNGLLVVLGTLLIAFGSGVFLVPFDLVAGGMSGLAIVLVKIYSSPFFTVDFYVTVMSWGFFALGVFTLGRTFALKTLISTLIYPPAFALCKWLVKPNVLGGIFDISAGAHTDAAIVVAAVFGGVCVGAGVALAFLGGGSTGGTDVLALIASKRVKQISSASLIFMLDAAVIVGGVFAVGDLVLSLLGIVSAFAASVVLDSIFGGSSRAFVANIVSEKPDLINKAVIEQLQRTTTIIPCIGGYSGAKKYTVTVSFGISEYSSLLASVLKNDPRAFITVHRAHEINGEGWGRDAEEQNSE